MSDKEIQATLDVIITMLTNINDKVDTLDDRMIKIEKKFAKSQKVEVYNK